MDVSRGIWVVAEIDGERPKEVTTEALCDARELADRIGGAVTAVVFGSVGAHVASHLGSYGAARLLVAAGSAEEACSAERCAAVLGRALDRETPRLILFGATVRGRDIACRVAAARNLALASDCNWVRLSPDGGVEAARVVYGGKLYARVRLTSTPALASLRPGAGGVGRRAARQPKVDRLPALDSAPARVEHVAFAKADPRTVDISEADRIVAVGRGIGASEHLDLYRRLADQLGAALAASRPLVDAGWLPFTRQVGQTGRVVAPRLYIAAGISGASQHTLGMKSSECVVAINRDKGAEIFKLADLKALADLEALMPELLQRLEARTAR
ncbi:MAG: electron transfer flavoprotein subunit alpha/FixB family protein [Candidatus Binatia bacterium]